LLGPGRLCLKLHLFTIRKFIVKFSEIPLYRTLYDGVHVLKFTLQTSLLFPSKWENVPIILA